jgi:penicillin-binding protein 2
MLGEPIDRELINSRINFIGGIALAATILFVSSFWYMQVVKGSYYEELAGENLFKEDPIPAPRGLILDRNKKILAENRLSHNLFLTPRLARNLSHTMEFLSAVLATPADELYRILKKEGSLQSSSPVMIYRDMSLQQLAYISARKIEYPELDIHHEQKRSYTYGPLFSHAIGYVGELTEDQERNREFPEARRRDIVGQAGLERYYNRDLMGRAGMERKVVNSYGSVLKEFPPTRDEPIPGRVLKAGIDAHMQKAAQDIFLEGDRYGAAVAMDIKTGEIMVLYNRPYYDPNDFIPKISPAKWKELISDEQHPLQNRAVQNKFSPGSTFKVVLALAALQEKKINPNTTFGCGGGQFIYNRVFRCWKPGGHGSVNLYKGIMQSCDVYFYNVGMRLDIDVIAKYARMLGLGSFTGIDVPNEVKGLVPDREWKRRTAHDKWYPGETISVAIGQGPILATAIQMLSLYSTVATDGVIVHPHLLSAVLDMNGKTLSTARVNKQQVTGIDRENFELVKKALWGVVNDHGTGGRARIDGYDVCGKTGTVQVVGFDRGGKGLSEKMKHKYGDHAWFISFAPYSDPQVAVAVFVEHGGHGSDAAAPVARKIFETYFLDRKLPPFSEIKGTPLKPLIPQSQPASEEPEPTVID